MSIRYGTQGESKTRCLGHEVHTVSADEIICHTCGTLVAGAQLGVYTVQRHLGRGRSGSAYLATHLRTHQPVVLKLFAPQDASVQLWELARREVRVATALRQGSILPIFSSTYWQPETARGQEQIPQMTPRRPTYLLTLCQYAPITLAHFVSQAGSGQASAEQRKRMLIRLLGFVRQLGATLSMAHARGIIHGALVPGNILLDEHDHVWLADFGLGRLHPPPQPYLAPELIAAIRAGQKNIQVYWEAGTPASDQYMLAILCEYMFSRLLRATDYEPLLPVLQCAASDLPTRRFASVDIFLHELIAQATRAYHLSSGEWQHYYTWNAPETPMPVTNPSRPLLGSGVYQRDSRPLSGATHMLTAPQTPTPSTSLPSVDDWERRGDKLFTMHDYENALRAYQRALEVTPDKAATWLALGDTHFALEDYQQALRAYERAMLLDPNEAQAWANRGTALDALGRHKEALDCYERAEQLR
ncbi:MAG: tetratricopeptide repeat protein [Ktedonobacteraceae bacterium]|nr:tetratricopeptide repeat protein [Ktedonobacteraceae bacterium]